MLEPPLHPAVLRIVSMLTPSACARDELAWRVLCAENIDTSIPLSRNVHFIHLLRVCDDTLLWGFLWPIKRFSELRNSFVFSIYANIVLAGHIFSFAIKKGRQSIGCLEPSLDVLIRSGILIIIFASNICMFLTGFWRNFVLYELW